MIAGGFACGGETTASRAVYSTQLSTETLLGKRRFQNPDPSPITFSDDDIARITMPHDDALVITAEINGCKVKRVLVDGGSSADILFLQCFKELGGDVKKLAPVSTPLVGFAGRGTYAEGAIRLPMTLGQPGRTITLNTNFLVVDAPATYNAIIGTSTINPHKMIPSTAHQVMRFPLSSGEIGEVWGDQETSRKCYLNVMRPKNWRHIAGPKDNSSKDNPDDPEADDAAKEGEGRRDRRPQE
jgi:hypothetical protein